MPNILLCSLGASWAVIPEIAAFVDAEHFELFANHPRRHQFARHLEQAGTGRIDQLWIATTEGEQTRKSVRNLLDWWRLLDLPVPLYIWQAAGTDQLASEVECARIRELLFRAVLLANEKRGDGRLWLSLAGGRKTMSADLQRAGQVLGCDALLHVVDDGVLTDFLRRASPADFAIPLPESEAAHLFPLQVGRGVRAELLDVTMDDKGAVSSTRFPLPLPRDAEPAAWSMSGGTLSLADEIAEREVQGGRLLGNYLHELANQERHENWRLLYRLPPRKIEELRHTLLNETHLDWLRRMPKADLHRHIGGSLTLAAQKRVARVVLNAMTPEQRRWASHVVTPMLKRREWPWNWPADLRRAYGNDRRRRAFLTATLLCHAGDGQLQQNLFDATGRRVALMERGFEFYERPGELTGSAILGAWEAIAPYARELVDQAVAEGLAYLELRGSPDKYDDDGLRFLDRLVAGLDAALASIPQAQRPDIRLLLIADRRGSDERIREVVSLAVRARQKFGSRVAGLDLAGDEAQGDPEQLSQLFRPAFEVCLPITIHAGEGQAPGNIWKSAYNLHADRVGHGLTLGEKPLLRDRFRDRGVCVELCPSSNLEVVGYYHPRLAPELARYYPLKEYWQAGVPVAICTDNPGISRTDAAREYLMAAQMVAGGITLWSALAMIKQGFAHAFLPTPEKERLMKRIDERIYNLLSASAGAR